MPHWINQPRQRNLNKTACGKTGAVQLCKQGLWRTRTDLMARGPVRPGPQQVRAPR
jgi:hypothetical protein